MRHRFYIVTCLLAFAALGIAVYVVNLLGQPEGSFYRGLATSEWESEVANWDVAQPTCGTDGYMLWVWRRPSAFARMCECAGIAYQQEQSTLRLVDGDPEAIPVLMELLKATDPKARRIAIEGIRRIGDPARIAEQLLIQALNDSDSNVSAEAAIALMKWDKTRVLKWLGGER
jgi:hypothetical protein